MSQLFKYGLLGAAVNLLGYAAYVTLTWLRVAPVLAMSAIYVAACLISFLGNKNWTFRNKSSTKRLFPKYFAIQVVGYFTNLALLVILSRILSFPHQGAQLVAIFIVAVELFLLNKYYVFRGNQGGVGS